MSMPRSPCSRAWQPNAPPGTVALGTANLQMKRCRSRRPSRVLICAAQKTLVAHLTRVDDATGGNTRPASARVAPEYDWARRRLKLASQRVHQLNPRKY